MALTYKVEAEAEGRGRPSKEDIERQEKIKNWFEEVKAKADKLGMPLDEYLKRLNYTNTSDASNITKSMQDNIKTAKVADEITPKEPVTQKEKIVKEVASDLDGVNALATKATASAEALKKMKDAFDQLKVLFPEKEPQEEKRYTLEEIANLMKGGKIEDEESLFSQKELKEMLKMKMMFGMINSVTAPPPSSQTDYLLPALIPALISNNKNDNKNDMIELLKVIYSKPDNNDSNKYIEKIIDVIQKQTEKTNSQLYELQKASQEAKIEAMQKNTEEGMKAILTELVNSRNAQVESIKQLYEAMLLNKEKNNDDDITKAFDTIVKQVNGIKKVNEQINALSQIMGGEKKIIDEKGELKTNELLNTIINGARDILNKKVEADKQDKEIEKLRLTKEILEKQGRPQQSEAVTGNQEQTPPPEEEIPKPQEEPPAKPSVAPEPKNPEPKKEPEKIETSEP